MNLFLFYFHNQIILNKETQKSIYLFDRNIRILCIHSFKIYVLTTHHNKIVNSSKWCLPCLKLGNWCEWFKY